jgi:tRNA A-37 threonylcarbamoyl transferase component Bud32
MALSTSIPAHCSLVEQGRISALLENEHRSVLLRLGALNPGELLARSMASGHNRFTGRGTLASLPLEESDGARVVVKQCLRGGLIRHLSSDLFCGGNRPFDEMRANRTIIERGVKTAEVIAAIKERVFGPFYRAYLFSLELPGCIDLMSYLNQLQDKSCAQRFRAKAGIFEALAHAFSAMHRGGIYHRDLHLKNVLLRDVTPHRAPEVFIIDFDRALVKTAIHPWEKLNNLMRFNRSIEKFRAYSGVAVTRGDQMRLCRAYLAENGDAARLLPRALRQYRVMTKLRMMKWGFRARTGY